MITHVVGIDEAGRGPLAGPVAVGVVAIPRGFSWRELAGVNDSKKLSERVREEIFMKTRVLQKDGALDYRVAMVGNEVIDRVGIARAVAMATARAIQRLDLNPNATKVHLDGLLKAPAEFSLQETFVKGDALFKEIGLASILAKVTRDRYMERVAKKSEFTVYNFHIHKGYGTKAHQDALREHGLSRIHRKSFCRKLIV